MIYKIPIRLVCFLATWKWQSKEGKTNMPTLIIFDECFLRCGLLALHHCIMKNLMWKLGEKHQSHVLKHKINVCLHNAHIWCLIPKLYIYLFILLHNLDARSRFLPTIDHLTCTCFEKFTKFGMALSVRIHKATLPSHMANLKSMFLIWYA